MIEPMLIAGVPGMTRSRDAAQADRRERGVLEEDRAQTDTAQARVLDAGGRRLAVDRAESGTGETRQWHADHAVLVDVGAGELRFPQLDVADLAREVAGAVRGAEQGVTPGLVVCGAGRNELVRQRDRPQSRALQQDRPESDGPQASRVEIDAGERETLRNGCAEVGEGQRLQRNSGEGRAGEERLPPAGHLDERDLGQRDRLDAGRVEVDRAQTGVREVDRAQPDRLDRDRAEAVRLQLDRPEAGILHVDGAQAEVLEFDAAQADRAQADRLQADRVDRSVLVRGGVGGELAGDQTTRHRGRADFDRAGRKPLRHVARGVDAECRIGELERGLLECAEVALRSGRSGDAALVGGETRGAGTGGHVDCVDRGARVEETGRRRGAAVGLQRADEDRFGDHRVVEAATGGAADQVQGSQ